MFSFIVISGDDKGKVIPINADFMSIGRSSKCDVVLSDKSISRKHVEILLTDGQVYIRDAGSSNGTYVNNVQIKEPALIKTNDYVRLGALMLQLLEEKGGSEITTEVKEDMPGQKVLINPDFPAYEKSKEIFAPMTSNDVTVNLEAISFDLFKDSHQRLCILYKVAEVIREIYEIDDLLNRVMDLIYKIFRYDNGFIMLKDESTGILSPKIVKKKNNDSQKINLSKTILDKVMQDKVSVLIENTASDKRFNEAVSIVQGKITSVMCAPLICKNEFLGIIYLDIIEGTLHYTEEELQMLNGVANQVAMAISFSQMMQKLKNHYRLEREIEIAREIQSNFLPKQLPRIKGFDVAGFCLPAHQVGGDYYDIFDLGDEEYLIMIVDVSGKGIPGVILANNIRLTIQMALKNGVRDLSKILTDVDNRIFVDGKQSMFATVVLGILDISGRIFTYINAGHNPPIILRPDGEISFLKTSHKLLGFSETIKCTPENIHLPVDSCLFLYTDGLPDLKNNDKDFFGEKKIRETLFEKRNFSASEIKLAFQEKITAFKSGAFQFDDITMLIIKSIK